VQTLAEAIEAAAAGADIIVAQGRDAGGHSGTTRGSMGLVPAVVNAVGAIPVVAAGGIADGRGLAAALALGAAGVLMGTRFAASAESLWAEAMKRHLIAAGGDETEQTRVFDIVRNAPWPTKYPGRAVRNAFSRRWHPKKRGRAARQPDCRGGRGAGCPRRAECLDARRESQAPVHSRGRAPGHPEFASGSKRESAFLDEKRHLPSSRSPC
jgi:nitronate monooxygenase